MGALRRATVREVEQLAEGDPSWWAGLCGEIAEKGAKAIYEEKAARCWAWGGLWQWIVADEKRYREYAQALEAYVQMKALETVVVAENATEDTVGMAKLRIDTSFRLAGKVDRARWGEKVEHAVAVAVVDAGLVGRMGALLERVRELPHERVVSEIPLEALSGPDEI